ncbi:MAG: hypothetical protein AB4352_29740 [Hormoscilla sp.]
MNTWRIDGLARSARQLLIFILATLICVGVAVSPAQAADPPPKVTPELIGSFDTPGYAKRVALADNRAYVADEGSGLQIIDVSDPKAPKLIGSFDTPGALGVALADNRAYVADYRSGLQIIDVSDPKAPTRLGSFDTPGGTRVAIADNRAYVLYGFNGLQIIDVSDPKAPKLIGSFDTRGYGRGVAIADNRAYVADDGSGVQIIDVSDPKAPTRLGSINTRGDASGVAIADNRAYVTERTSGLQITDVSDPKAPTRLGSFDTRSYANGVAIADNRAYVANSVLGVQIIDVSDPKAPKLIGSFDTPNIANGVAIADNRAYVADGNSGLQIIDVTPDIPTIPVNLSVAVTETGFPTVTITATTEAPVVGSQTIDVALGGTATADDFTTPIPATITISDGATEGSFTLNIREDNLSEGTETATFTISNPSSGLTLGATTVAEIAIADGNVAPTSDNLVVNGSFEEPVGSSSSLESIPGWQLGSGPSIELQRGSVGDGTAYDGDQKLELDSTAISKIYQDIPTEVGKVYELTFAFSPRPHVEDNRLRVLWGGTLVADLKENGEGLSGTKWTEYSYKVLALCSSTRLSFDNLEETSNGGGSYIDKVSVTLAENQPVAPDSSGCSS